MVDNGYWIECIPLRRTTPDFKDIPPLYHARIRDLPDLDARGLSPDRAISKLRRKLEKLRSGVEGEAPLPRPHSRLFPPPCLRDVDGWMLVYLELKERARLG